MAASSPHGFSLPPPFVSHFLRSLRLGSCVERRAASCSASELSPYHTTNSSGGARRPHGEAGRVEPRAVDVIVVVVDGLCARARFESVTHGGACVSRRGGLRAAACAERRSSSSSSRRRRYCAGRKNEKKNKPKTPNPKASLASSLVFFSRPLLGPL